MANPVGRPPMFKTKEALEKKIDEYFANVPTATKHVASGVVVEVPVPTITGLSLFLGFCDRRSFYEYEEKPLFTHTIKKARTFIEKHYEEMLQVGNTTGAIFALKNFGWRDQRETVLAGDKENPIEMNMTMSGLLDEDLKDD